MNKLDHKMADDTHPADDGPPVFDVGLDDLPWPQEHVLPIDDDGNILPGNDTIDDDPNDNGDLEQNDPEDRKPLPI